jgi:hypothetical protein
MRTVRSIVLATLIAGVVVIPVTASPDKQPVVTSEEAVLFGDLINESAENGIVERPLVADQTNTLECNNVCNGLKIGDCGSGMRSAEMAIPTLLKQLQQQLPGLTQQMADSFAARNRSCAKVDHLPPGKPARYIFSLAEFKAPAEWKETPDYFYFSRAAFNRERTRALVFVVVLDHKAAVSGGYYLLMKKTPRGWRTDYNLQQWSLVPSS